MEFKRICLIAIILFGTFSVKAQENFFVYLQTENNKPFYARLNNKVISSSSSGYLILPKISEGKYDLSIGFPKNEFGEESFTINVEDKSQGYLLKDFGDKGWSLFNLQTLALLSPNNSASPAAGVATVTEIKEDPFSQMLASVTKDSTLLRKSMPAQAVPVEPVKKEINSVKESEVVAVIPVTEQKKAEEEETETASNQEIDAREKVQATSEVIYSPDKKITSQPVKILGVVGREGNEMIYVDKTSSSTDTITVFIPNEKEQSGSEITDITIKEVAPVKKEPEFTITPTIVSPVKEEGAKIVNVKVKEETENQADIINEKEAKKPVSQVFIIRDDSAAKPKEKSEESMILIPAASAKTVNSDCKDLANNNDFLRIRKRMAAEKDKDAMVLAAKKIFKTKCFSTEQIRNLSYLFLSDEGRYMFFDAAYPYTSDTDKYPTLISQLKDEYYINRFEAMIQK